MQNEEFNVLYEKRKIFDFLKFYVAPSEGIIKYLSSSLKDMLKEYQVAEENVVNFNIQKINPDEILGLNFNADENFNDVFRIEIKFCKISRAELNAMKKEDRIRAVLNHIGYSDRDILYISYKKYWSNSDEKVWVARVIDNHYNDLDDDEVYAKGEYSSGIIGIIHEILNILVIVDLD